MDRRTQTPKISMKWIHIRMRDRQTGHMKKKNDSDEGDFRVIDRQTGHI